MRILGMNAYHADASAALVIDGELMACAEEERFNRIKHAAGFPKEAVRFCLESGRLQLKEIDIIGISRDPRANLIPKLRFALSRRPDLSHLVTRIKNLRSVATLRETLAREFQLAPSDIRAKIYFVEHHRAHLSSAFLVSGFEEAACLSLDGFGDFASTMMGIWRGRRLRIIDRILYPHSLGVFYTAVTQYLGFPHYGDEYKVMGLAAFGSPGYLDFFRKLIRWRSDLNFELNLEYFSHARGNIDMTWEEGAPVLGALFSHKLVEALGPVRKSEEPIKRRHEEIAASLQAVLEESLLRLIQGLYQRTRVPQLAYAGGVAFNSVANGRILKETPFKQWFIQPAAGDGGTSLGAAFFIHEKVSPRPVPFKMEHAYWGPSYAHQAIEGAIEKSGLPFRKMGESELVDLIAHRIEEGKIIGWFQGRMEFGPRALGNRSILVDPRRAEMKDILNERIKRREPFRPFAPSVIEEALSEFFEEPGPSPYMLSVYRVRPEKRSLIPAVTHVDGTGRVQTVSRKSNPRYWRLIHRFGELTGVPILLNTSFNEQEPIVCSPEDALQCYQRTRMDLLVIEDYLIERS